MVSVVMPRAAPREHENGLGLGYIAGWGVSGQGRN